MYPNESIGFAKFKNNKITGNNNKIIIINSDKTIYSEIISIRHQ